MRQGIEGLFARTMGWLMSRLSFGAVPPFTAATAIIEQNGRFLTIRRSDGLGLNLPGGYLRWQERVEDGLRREVYEETGYLVSIDRLAGVYSGPMPNQRLSCVVLAFRASIVGGWERGSFEGEPVWAQLEELPGRMAFADETILFESLKRTAQETPRLSLVGAAS